MHACMLLVCTEVKGQPVGDSSQPSCVTSKFQATPTDKETGLAEYMSWEVEKYKQL